MNTDNLITLRYRKCSKQQLIAELLESDRTLRANAKQIFALGEKGKQYETALKEIVDQEEMLMIQTFMGNTARAALQPPDEKAPAQCCGRPEKDCDCDPPNAPGSAWQRVNAVMAAADTLEELIRLRMERRGETEASAMKWAKEMYQRYSSNPPIGLDEGRRNT